MIVDIDLGTTNSAVAMLVEGKVQVLAADKEPIIPSYVGLLPEGQLLVGTPARNQYILYPELTLRSIKLLMGSDQRLVLGERTYSPPEISALILRPLKSRAEAALGGPVSRAVIAVPAYFSEARASPRATPDRSPALRWCASATSRRPRLQRMAPTGRMSEAGERIEQPLQ